ncbi:MAG TPA: pilus assembly protein PilY, partial [Burkholderiaceae bacterium]|nr:pilus assembly protein PilY [Burkholderiaceae bacterium]
MELNRTAQKVRALAGDLRVRLGAIGLVAVAFIGIAVSGPTPPPIPAIPLAAEPLYARGARAKPTLTLALSVEFPTVGAQYVNGADSSNDNTYASTTEYVGYFDAESCYSYNNNADPNLRRFDRIGAATARECAGTGFSGNFMNWATSSAIDILRYGLTGGDRVVDTTTLTVLQRAYLPTRGDNNPGNFYNGSNFPSKRITNAQALGALPSAMLGSHTGDVYIANCKNRVHFGTSKAGNCDAPGANSNLGVASAGASSGPVTAYSGTLPADFGAACANENGTCSFSGILQVAYGANTSWKFMSAKDGTPCTNA